MTRRAYWHRHPRGFANECTPVYTTTAQQAEDAREMGFERLDVRRLRRHLAWMNGENESWGSNRAIGVYRFAEIDSLEVYTADRS